MKFEIKLPPEFISGNEIPVSVATIKRGRMEEILREAIQADRHQRGEPVAVIRFERNKQGTENEMPRVISCNRLPDGDYQVFLAPQPSGPTQQYYYRVTGCKADKTTSPNCICWHDKGTGPFPEHKEGIEVGGVLVSWRVKPTSSTQEPSVGQIMEAVKSYGSVCRQPNTTVSEQEMRLHEIHALLARYGANHE